MGEGERPRLPCLLPTPLPLKINFTTPIWDSLEERPADEESKATQKKATRTNAMKCSSSLYIFQLSRVHLQKAAEHTQKTQWTRLGSVLRVTKTCMYIFTGLRGWTHSKAMRECVEKKTIYCTALDASLRARTRCWEDLQNRLECRRTILSTRNQKNRCFFLCLLCRHATQIMYACIQLRPCLHVAGKCACPTAFE